MFQSWLCHLIWSLLSISLPFVSLMFHAYINHNFSIAAFLQICSEKPWPLCGSTTVTLAMTSSWCGNLSAQILVGKSRKNCCNSGNKSFSGVVFKSQFQQTGLGFFQHISEPQIASATLLSITQGVCLHKFRALT